ncbi:hypothetical protein C8R44DRAFT_733887 [Mycena epipterygia]|nr:hypothetical protein C8R44DRAFT_733887 [Mycena epipterygia]
MTQFQEYPPCATWMRVQDCDLDEIARLQPTSGQNPGVQHPSGRRKSEGGQVTRAVFSAVQRFVKAENGLYLASTGRTLDCTATDARLGYTAPAIAQSEDILSTIAVGNIPCCQYGDVQETSRSGWVQLVRKSSAGESNSREQVDGLGGVLEPSTRRGLDSSQRSTRPQPRRRASEHGTDTGVPPAIK